ncbi:MAG: ATP-binding protein [Roseobacter sp.]
MSANSKPDGTRSGIISFGKHDSAEDIMLRKAATVARLGFFVVDMKTCKIETCSARHAEIFGVTPDQFVARATGLNGELAMVHPDDREYLRAGYARLSAGEEIELEYRFLKVDGSWGTLCEHVAPEFDAKGTLVRALGSSRDVTQTRMREEQSFQSERLETLGVLTAGVAHDFNNILAVVMGNAQLGQAHTPTVLMHEILEEIVEAAQRGARLTKSLLAFAQRATMVPRITNLNKVVADVVRDFERTEPRDISLSVELSKGDPSLLVDTEQLQIVLLNILTNAAEASTDGGQIMVSVWTTSQTDSTLGEKDPADVQDGVCSVSVRDMGIGIPDEHLNKVTEPFFTTKNRAKGSGLGLSMAHGFAHQSGGSLDIVSRKGEGTTVTLRLPQADGVTTDQENDAGLPDGATPRHVLLLEDDVAVRDVVSRQLEAAGYSVTSAHRPEEALELMGTHSFDVAVFDNILPGDMNGVDVARALRLENNKIPIVLLTGLPTYLSDQHLAHVDALLHKPVPIGTLLKQIEVCLSQEA